MKKWIIKSIVFVLVFVGALLLFSRVMNQDHDNLTMEMAAATLPVVRMEWEDMEYNQLHGYTEVREVAFERETITVLDAHRDCGLVVDTYGREVTGISFQVRSADGSRLIEDTVLTEYEQVRDQVFARFSLKDLIERDTEYSLTVILELDGRQEVYYYTRVVWSDSLHVEEKLAFVEDFHKRLYHPELARELTKYLETDARLEDNSSFHKVNIHSSFRQLTWDELEVQEVGTPTYQLTAIAGQTASVLVNYMVSTGRNEDMVYYRVQEYYRVRYTTERMYLLDYERTTTQIPDVKNMYANDKILLGIVGEGVPLQESEDGNIVVFEVAGKLCSYNLVTNKLAVIFSFYDEKNQDARAMYSNHSIKILDTDEGGNIYFAVYGYMNRGRHEGELGIQICHYDSALNTIEELIYLPYSKSYAVLRAELEQVLYLNRERRLYLSLENSIYEIDLAGKTYGVLATVSQDDSIQISDNHKIVVWQEGEDIYHCDQLIIKNLNTGRLSRIYVEKGEAVRPLGFMGEDIIYGVARLEDVAEESSGRIFFPMYKIGICNAEGDLLKEYAQENIYVIRCSVEDNQITLDRLARDEEGQYQETNQDHIMNSVEEAAGKNTVATAVIDIYKKYVQIKVGSSIDSASLQVLTPKEVVFEEGRELQLALRSQSERYYVHGPYGVAAIYNGAGKAIELAYEIAGEVIDDSGRCVWMRGNRVARNQIMAIGEESVTEEKNSLVVCLDTMLKFEGIIRNSEYLLQQGQSAVDILSENLPDARVLDLAGCTLDAVLYYVNQDIPVLALVENDEAVLITGFNEYQIVILEPSTGKLYKKGMADSAQWFAENGNSFLTYMRNES